MFTKIFLNITLERINLYSNINQCINKTLDILYPLLKNREQITILLPKEYIQNKNSLCEIDKDVRLLYPCSQILFGDQNDEKNFPDYKTIFTFDTRKGKKEDIYMPMGVSCINKNGQVISRDIMRLIIDNSDDIKILQFISDILKAEKDVADTISDFVWILSSKEEENFVSELINSGFPISSFIEKNDFIESDKKIYNKSVLMLSNPEDELKEQINYYIKSNGKVILCNKDYFDFKKIFKVAEDLGYIFKYSDNNDVNKFAFSRADNGLFVSVHSPDTTIESNIKLPIGAPIFCGFEAKIIDGVANYQFTKSEHMECRVFVEQKNGWVGVKEQAPVNYLYRRRVMVYGLENATVRFFGEEYAKKNVKAVLNSVGDHWVKSDEFEYEFVESENGTYLEARNITGTMVFSMPRHGLEKEVYKNV